MPAGAPPPPCCNGGACPCRAIRKLHLETSKTLDVEPEVKLEVEILLQELQQLLIGISIMQVTSGGGGGGQRAAMIAPAALCADRCTTNLPPSPPRFVLRT